MLKQRILSAFKRVWSYVWPQWPRVIAVIFWSGLMACMLGISLVTLMPILKVMMGEEGLHGWVDRKIVDHRYGMAFYLPDRADLYQSADVFSSQLVVVGIDKEAGEGAACRTDRIVWWPNRPMRDFSNALKMQNHCRPAGRSSR